MLIVTCVAFFRALYTADARKAKENGYLPATASGVDKSARWARFRTQAPAARAKTARPAQRIRKGMNSSSPGLPGPFPAGHPAGKERLPRRTPFLTRSPVMKVLATPRSFGKNNPELFDILRHAGLDVVRNDTGGILSAARMREKLADCDGLIVGVDPVDATVLAAAPRLRAIAKYGVGLDNIDLAACEARGIKVSRTVGANSEAVADYALALMLGVARKVALIDRRCRERDWSKITGIDLYGKTVGIIGLGAIGKRVARRCGAGFGMKVLGHDIVWDDAWASENHVERADLERIFREADFISLHTSLDDSTRHLVDAPRLALMKPTAILINTARGELVDGPALLEALEQKRIYGAGLDVFEQEPPQDARWYALDNLVMGSHCSSSTSGAVATMGHMAVSNLLRDLGLK